MHVFKIFLFQSLTIQTDDKGEGCKTNSYRCVQKNTYEKEQSTNK